MAEETQYTCKLKAVLLTTANSNLDGTGTLGTLNTGGTGGTILKRVFIKAQVSTTRGMIRFFINGGGNTRLLKEVDVLPVTKSGTAPSFEAWVDLDFFLQEGYILKASTQNSENIQVLVEAYEFAYYGTSVREDTTQYYANNGTVSISTANSNLDGTGTLGTAFTAGDTATYKGTSVQTITIQATGSTTAGMIRLFLVAGASKIIFHEVPVPTITPSGTDKAFEHTVHFKNDLDMQGNVSIAASTQNAETFLITVEGQDWKYAS